MVENFLQLKQDKTEVLIIGPEGKRENFYQNYKILNLQSVQNLGVIFDSELGFISHIKNVT